MEIASRNLAELAGVKHLSVRALLASHGASLKRQWPRDAVAAFHPRLPAPDAPLAQPVRQWPFIGLFAVACVAGLRDFACLLVATPSQE